MPEITPSPRRRPRHPLSILLQRYNSMARPHSRRNCDHSTQPSATIRTAHRRTGSHRAPADRLFGRQRRRDRGADRPHVHVPVLRGEHVHPGHADRAQRRPVLGGERGDPARHRDRAAGRASTSSSSCSAGRARSRRSSRRQLPELTKDLNGRTARRHRRELDALGQTTTSTPRPARRSRSSTAATSTCCPTSSTSRASGTTRSSSPTTASTIPTTWDELVDAAETSSRRRRHRRSRPPATRAGRSPASSAATSSATSARTRCRRSPTATPSSPTPSTSRQPLRRSPTSARRATSAQGSARSTTTPRSSQFLTGKAGMFYMGSWTLGRLQRPGAEPDRRGQHRLHPVPDRRGRRGLDRPAPGERRCCRSRCRQALRRQRRRLARAASPRTTAAQSLRPGHHLGLQADERPR